MNHRFYLYVSLLMLAVINTSFSWPVRTPAITSTFGESRWDHFHDGIDVVSSVDRIYPVESGSLVYLWDKSLFPLENYPGGGNYKIIRHGGDKFSFYMHLEDGVPLKKIYTAEDYVGVMGNSGRSNGKHLHFSVINSKTAESINPLLELPQLKDAREPKIGDLSLRIGEKYVTIRNKSSIRLTQHYPALVKIDDAVRGQERLGIFKLTAFMNEKKVLDLDFSRMTLGEKGFQISGINFDGIYDSRGYYKIDGIKYVQGRNEIRIIASDYAGNTSEKTFVLDVNLDIQ